MGTQGPDKSLPETQLFASASRYHHRFDNEKGKKYTWATTGVWFKQLESELKKLFSFEGGKPLVLRDSYTHGFLQSMRLRVNLLIYEAALLQGRLQQ